MKPVFRLWLDQGGKAFGDGPYELLKRVEATGSLHKAAAQMGMAYSKAWKLTRLIEQRLGFMVLEREVGGRFGGGSRITTRAKMLISCYGVFREEAQEALNRIFQKRFHSFIEPEPARELPIPYGKKATSRQIQWRRVQGKFLETVKDERVRK
jgi:molybdate transport system regulatory protein